MSISSGRSAHSERSYYSGISTASHTASTKSKASSKSSGSTKSTSSSRSFNPHKHQYHVVDEMPNWWSIGDFMQPGLTHQSVGLSLYSGRNIFDNNSEETWDLRESLEDLYREVDRRSQVISSSFRKSIVNNNKVDIQSWINKDTNNGFIRVFSSETITKVSHLVPCTLNTTAQRICYQCNMPPNSLYVQLNGDIIRRLEPFDCPLAIQNDYLTTVGYSDLHKIQEEGANEDLSYLVRFYAGKPFHDGTYARKQLQSYLLVRKGKLLYQWVRRLCIISGTRLFIHRDKDNPGKPLEVQLAKGSVEEVKVKGHDYCLKVTSTLQGEKSIHLSFTEEAEFNKWLRKAKKATSKLPTKADLSNCHLEFLPETIFINDELKILNLRHNVLRERPIEEDIYTIGWLDDLHRFYKLQSLNLADNDLTQFPQTICSIKTLAELNLASNKISEIPPEITDLKNLQILQLHNNHLFALPEGMSLMKKLVLLTLAFNHFTTVPYALLQSPESGRPKVDSFILAGNNIDRLTHDILQRMSHVRKLDLRLNKLVLPPSEQGKLSNLENITHLDLRDNNIAYLDVRCLKKVEYFNCCRNKLRTLQVSGVSLKIMLASHNKLSAVSISPKPEYLETLDVSHNIIIDLPEWIVDSFFLVKLNISHNKLIKFPLNMFVNCKKLKVCRANHNSLFELPLEINPLSIEEFYLQHNQLTHLPDTFLAMANKLKILNAAHNNLRDLPPLNRNESLNKLQELYLTSNHLENDAVRVLCGYPRLKVLHLAHNRVTEIMDRDIGRLELLQELNISGNMLTYLPSCLTHHSKLTILRVNSNRIDTLPDFGKTQTLRVLELSSNKLHNISMSNLSSSQLNLLDVSGNPQLMVDCHELEGLRAHKKLRTVDSTGTNRLLWDLTYQQKEAEERLAERQRWLAGFSQTSGNRNKLSVKVLSNAQLRSENDGLFAVFDGGHNGDVAQMLYECIPNILQQELTAATNKELYMKYTVLTAHKKLKATGQKLGASAVICHISKSEKHGQLVLNVANVGDCELVLCRHGSGYCLTRPFMVSRDRDECKRILRSDGIITEDDKVNGISSTTRMMGCAYLYPQVIPNPHFFITVLHPDDEFIIMANKGLWQYIDYQEAVDLVQEMNDPLAAAKKLQDLAQAYGSKENIGILILRIKPRNEHGHSNGMTKHDSPKPSQSILSDGEVRIATESHDWMQTDWGSAFSLSTTTSSDFEAVSLDSDKSFENLPLPASESKKMAKIAEESAEMEKSEILSVSMNNGEMSIRPLPRHRYATNNAAEEWEAILQDRLSEEVKVRELQYVLGSAEDDIDTSFGIEPPNGTSSNWSTVGKKEGAKLALAVNAKDTGEVNEKPKDIHDHNDRIVAKGISHPVWTQSQLTMKLKQVAESSSVVEDPEPIYATVNRHNDSVRYVGPTVDRDALLFHEMNRARAQSSSLASIDTVMSDVVPPSKNGLKRGFIPVSHSIEVIVRDDLEPDYIQEESEVREGQDRQDPEAFDGYCEYIDDSDSSIGDFSLTDVSFDQSDLDINSNSIIHLGPESSKSTERTPTNSGSEETLKSLERDRTPTNSMYGNLNKLQTASQYSVAQISKASSMQSVPSLVITHL